MNWRQPNEERREEGTGFKTLENTMVSQPARQNISEKPIVCLAKQPKNWKVGDHFGVWHLTKQLDIIPPW